MSLRSTYQNRISENLEVNNNKNNIRNSQSDMDPEEMGCNQASM